MQKDEGRICLGIDWGEKRIGLALGDSATKVATPWKTVADLSEVLTAVAEEGPEIVVVGAPYKYPGSSELSDDFVRFLKRLKGEVRAEVVTVDERLTSKEADSLPGDAKLKADRDPLAAMLILRQYLEEGGSPA